MYASMRLAAAVAVLLTLTSAQNDRRVLLGVDYYPEQWPVEEMRADMEAIKNDLGADIVRMGEFMWHELEPMDGVFNWTRLDTILDLADKIGLDVMLGTPTATMPAWLHKAHPEVMHKGPDSPDGYAGAVAGFGGRRQYSFNSDTYLRYAKRITNEMVARYSGRKVVTHWQVDNEIAHEGSDLDFSDAALDGWRAYLEAAYGGDIGKLNADWGTAFWSVTYNEFDEIPLPAWTVPGSAAHSNEEFRSNVSPGMLLDYRRFRRDSVTGFADAQVRLMREAGIEGGITTNAPGGFWGKAIDHNDIFASMDMVAYDNYPVWGGSLAPDSPSLVAMTLDTVRGWAAPNSNSTGWMVAEQLIGAQGHDIIGFNPRPGQVKGWSAQTLTHGAEALVFFRYRAAVFGQEEFCYGVLDHYTPRGTGRKWAEAKEVYALARDHEELWLAPIQARVALLYDMENIFAWQAQPQSTAFDFATEAHRLYYPFWRNGVAVDVVSATRALGRDASAEAAAALLGRYRVLVLPALMIVPDADHTVAVLESYVEAGGSLWIGYRSDLKDPRSQIRRASSRLAQLAGVTIAEIESLNDPLTATVQLASDPTVTAEATVFREGVAIDSSSTSSEKSQAEAVWQYDDSFFGAAGYVAVTKRSTDAGGEVVYVGAGLEPAALVSLATQTLARQGVQGAGVSDSDELEQVLRQDTRGNVFSIAINHGDVSATTSDGTELAPYEVVIASA